MTAPGTLGPSGARLWDAITDVQELDAHEETLLLEACRVADRLDGLHGALTDGGLLVDGKPHPALVEARQQQVVLARLVASLRLPDDLLAGSRPQRRGAARGAYLRGVS